MMRRHISNHISSELSVEGPEFKIASVPYGYQRSLGMHVAGIESEAYSCLSKEMTTTLQTRFDWRKTSSIFI